jgi:YD repeat-containing protein
MNKLFFFILITLIFQTVSGQTVHSKKYDNFNRLIESSDGTNTVVYTYDELGNRTQESVTVTLSVSEEQIVGLKLYPNPTPKLVTITAKNIINKVLVYDNLGRRTLIKKIKNAKNSIEVDISKFSVGIYHFVVYSEGKKQSLKVVKR